MATRSMGPGKGWDWLVRAVNLGSRNPKALLGAAAILLVIAMVPTVLQVLFQQGDSMPSPVAMGGWMGFTLLYSVLVMPPAMAGFLRVIHATETGAPTHATAILDGYRQGAGRIIALVLVLMVFAIAVFALLMFVFGGMFLTGLMEFMTAAQSASTSGGKPDLPALPEGFGTMIGLLALFGLFFNGVYALSVGQVALASRGIGEALRDGIVGTVKNVLPLLVLLVIALVVGLLAGLVLALVMGLLAMLGGLIHPVVAMVLVAPVYLFLMLAIYVIAFGVMYAMWRDICADEGDLPAVREDQLEV